jgi:hypothetical protein
LMPSASATDDPPYFCTTMAMVCLHLVLARLLARLRARSA